MACSAASRSLPKSEITWAATASAVASSVPLSIAARACRTPAALSASSSPACMKQIYDWVLARLYEAAQQAIGSGAPKVAADLLNRAMAEPPPAEQRIDFLRRTARAEVSAGRETALVHLEEALGLAANPRERAEIALEVGEAYAGLCHVAGATSAMCQRLMDGQASAT